MTSLSDSTEARVLVAIDIAKKRNDVLIEHPIGNQLVLARELWLIVKTRFADA